MTNKESDHRVPLGFRAVPVASVKDVRASVAYYSNVLGFAKEWDVEGEHGALVVAGLNRREGLELILEERGEKPGFGVHLLIELDPTDKLELLHQEFVAKGAIILEPPTMKHWGWTVMSVSDPDGNLLEFAGDEREDLKPR